MNNAQPSSPVTFDVEHIPVVDDPRVSEKSQPTEEHRQAEKLSGTLFCPILCGTAWVSSSKQCSALFRDKGELFNRRSALFGSVNHPLCTFLHCHGLAQRLRIYRYLRIIMTRA